VGFEQILDGWPVSDLEDRLGKDLKSRLMVHFNNRYDCSVKMDEKGVVEWADEVEPDDDSHFVAVFRGTDH
jgi:hypothetical protein